MEIEEFRKYLENYMNPKMAKLLQAERENYRTSIRKLETKEHLNTLLFRIFLEKKLITSEEAEALLNAFDEPTSEDTPQIKTGKLNKTLLEEVKKILKKYIDTSSQNMEILSLWLVGTYFHNQFETYPLLQLLAQKRSGKTRTLKLLSALAYGSDGSVSTSVSETHLFRHKEGALFFDEMENINSKERGAFRETLNAVYKKGNKIVRYQEGKNKEYVEKEFFPYYPIGLANISGLNDVLSDRAIQIILRRSDKSLTKLIEDFRTNEKISNIKKRLELIKADIPQDLSSEWNEYIQGIEMKNKDLTPLFEKICKTGISGRSLELFFPLFIISYLSEDIDNFLQTAKDYVQQKEEEDSTDDIDELLKNFLIQRILQYAGFVSVSTILNDFRSVLESPEEWINNKWLGRALKRLDFIQTKRLVNGRTQVILKYLNTNSTNPINPINSINSIISTNSTNSTKDDVDFVDNVDKIERIQEVQND